MQKILNSVWNSKMFYLIKNQIRNLFYKKTFFKRLNHHHKSFQFTPGVAANDQSQFDDTKLIERLKALYLICNTNFGGNKNSMWTAIFEKRHGDIHAAFLNGDHNKIVDIVRNPKKYNFFYGFENLSRDLIIAKRLEDKYEGEMVMDSLISLCEAVGVIKIASAELVRIVKSINIETALQLLDKEFGFNIRFPNLFEGEFGVVTSKGIVSCRAVQALYQAWRVTMLVKTITNPSILEIGGGLGRTAYYCKQFGIQDYTIVDIPISSIAQANFLGRLFPENELFFLGEKCNNKDISKRIKLIDPSTFFTSDKNYNLIINIDSLTELDINISKSYLQKISEVGNLFLSINHENNSFSINTIFKEVSGIKRLFRYPYWVRRGYAEELFEKC